MFIILSILLLIMIYALLTPYSIQERLENPSTQSQSQSDSQSILDANMINTIKNQINILELKVDGIKRQLATTDVTVTANQTAIEKFNKMIDELQKQLKEAESSMS